MTDVLHEAGIAASMGLTIFYAGSLVYANATKADTFEAGCGLFVYASLLLIMVFVAPHVSVTIR